MSPPKMSDRFPGFLGWNRMNMGIFAKYPWNFIAQYKTATTY